MESSSTLMRSAPTSSTPSPTNRKRRSEARRTNQQECTGGSFTCEGARGRSRIESRPWGTLGLAVALLLLSLGCASSAPEASSTDAAQAPKKYVVKIDGRNLLVREGDDVTRLGFFTTRHVVAATPEEAERIAVQQVRDDDQLQSVLVNEPSDPPNITAAGHVEVKTFDADSSPDLGYIFYRDHDAR